MNKRTLIASILAIILLSSMLSTFPVQAASPRTVYGELFIDGELAQNEILVKLTFSDQEITNNTYHNGNYVMNYIEDNYEEGTFSVYYQGTWHSTTPPTVELGNQHELLYNVDLYVSLPPNSSPNKPILIKPSDGSTVESINFAALEVKVTDPDNDNMKVTFFDASDDSLIHFVNNVANGNSATVPWSGLSSATTYQWYAIANDSEFETKSDTWSFTTNDLENIPPTVSITKPEKAFYIFNQKIFPRFIRLALIIGKITITADATDEDSGIEKVEFYINGNLKGNDTEEPYTYDWTRDRLRLFHFFIIKVIAYDNDGATAKDSMFARKFL